MGICSKPLLLLLILSALASCSGYHAGQVYHVETERVVAKPFDSVWASLVDFCHINNFDITETDTTTGFLSFYGSSERPDLDSTFDCGKLGAMDGEISSRNFKCNVILHRASWDSTLVTVRPYETASLHLEGDRWKTADCNSTGKFEHRVLDALSGAPTHFTVERIDTAEPTVEVDTEFSGWRFWLGASMLPFTIRNIRDVHLSDWQQHTFDSAEGRLLLPLTDLKTSGNHGGGVVAIGYDAGSWTPFGELQLDFPGSSTAVLFSFGTLIGFGHSNNLSFNLVPKIGWFGTTNDMVLSEVGGRYTSVELPATTLYSGDTVTARYDGLLMQLGLDAEYGLSDRASLYLAGSYTRTSFGKINLQMGDNNIDIYSPAVTEATLTKGFGSTLHASISPQVSSTGLAVQLGVRIRMH
jgi:hypothetical protein